MWTKHDPYNPSENINQPSRYGNRNEYFSKKLKIYLSNDLAIPLLGINIKYSISICQRHFRIYDYCSDIQIDKLQKEHRHPRTDMDKKSLYMW